MPKKWLLSFLFIIITIVSLSLMTYQSNRQHFLPLQSLHNILNTLHNFKNSFKKSLTAPFKQMLIREEENIELKKELSKMLKEQQEYRELLHENRRLRNLLSLKEQERKYVTSARIIGKSPDYWSNKLILDKGLSDGVTKDMIAITDKGLAGKITDASDKYSYLLLVSDINFSASVRLQESRTEGILSGTGFRKCQLKYVPYEIEVKKGEIVITSGLDLLFPPGIPVGVISKINKKDIGMFQDIEVYPFVDNTKIEEVIIIKKG